MRNILSEQSGRAERRHQRGDEYLNGGSDAAERRLCYSATHTSASAPQAPSHLWVHLSVHLSLLWNKAGAQCYLLVF